MPKHGRKDDWTKRSWNAYKKKYAKYYEKVSNHHLNLKIRETIKQNRLADGKKRGLI
jgi:hypothetical protein